MMNWTFLLMAFCVALVMGASAASLLARVRPQWSERCRLVVAAGVLPAVTLLASLAGIGAAVATDAGEGEDMQDLVIATIAALGGLFGLLAFVGGLIGAALLHRRLRR